MESIQVGQLKKDFSSILQQVQLSKKKFIIEYGRKHKKIAMIIPYDHSYEKKEKRKFGLYKNKGSFKINKGFEMSEKELLEL